MSTLKAKAGEARIKDVQISEDTLRVELLDARTLSVPLAWFPRLLHGTKSERGHWRLIGQGEGIHWPDLDEDISVDNLLTGQPSAESQASLRKWLEQRGRTKSSRRVQPNRALRRAPKKTRRD